VFRGSELFVAWLPPNSILMNTRTDEVVTSRVIMTNLARSDTGFAVHRNGGCVSPTCRLLGVWGGKGWFSFYHPLGNPDRARECAGSRPAAGGRGLMLLPSHARGTMSVLRPEARHLSPAVGLALSSGGSHLLSRLFELEPTLADGALIETAAGVARWKGTPVCRLIRQLFHRQHPAETLKITANRSLPAAHLSPSLAGASHISHRSSHLSPLTSYLALLTSCLSLLASHLSPLTSRLPSQRTS
jgi:hypothetical protein